MFEYTILNTGNEIKISQLLDKIDSIKYNRAETKEKWTGKIYTLVGSPGSGKDSLLEMAMTQGLLYSLVMPKHTTRKRRDEDGGELICIDDEDYDMDSCDIRYENYGTIYGIKTKDLENRLNDGLSSSIIISNLEAFKKLEKKFPESLVKIYIHGLSKEEYLEKHKDELNDEYISSRVEKYDSADDSYRNHWLDFDHVIINNGNLIALKNQMYNIMKYYETNRKIDINSYNSYIDRIKKYIKTNK